jgi:hypothetical protein
MRRLHRTLGASAAAFILFMALSGMAINHAGNLELDRQHVTQPFLLSWYGIGEPAQIRSFFADGNWLSFADSQVHFNGRSISSVSGGVGAVSSDGITVAAGSSELLLLDREGNLIERMAWNQPDAGVIESIGLLENGRVAIKSSSAFWSADADLLQWQPMVDIPGTVAWAEPASEPYSVTQSVIRQYRGTGLSMERLLLDFHSGRIFGPAGVLVYDLLALVVGFLAVSGIVFWVRGRKNGRKKYPKF